MQVDLTPRNRWLWRVALLWLAASLVWIYFRMEMLEQLNPGAPRWPPPYRSIATVAQAIAFRGGMYWALLGCAGWAAIRAPTQRARRGLWAFVALEVSLEVLALYTTAHHPDAPTTTLRIFNGALTALALGGLAWAMPNLRGRVAVAIALVAALPLHINGTWQLEAPWLAPALGTGIGLLLLFALTHIDIGDASPRWTYRGYLLAVAAPSLLLGCLGIIHSPLWAKLPTSWRGYFVAGVALLIAKAMVGQFAVAFAASRGQLPHLLAGALYGGALTTLAMGYPLLLQTSDTPSSIELLPSTLFLAWLTMAIGVQMQLGPVVRTWVLSVTATATLGYCAYDAWRVWPPFWLLAVGSAAATAVYVIGMQRVAKQAEQAEALPQARVA